MRTVRVAKYWVVRRGQGVDRLVLEGHRVDRNGETTDDRVRVELGMDWSDWQQLTAMTWEAVQTLRDRVEALVNGLRREGG